MELVSPYRNEAFRYNVILPLLFFTSYAALVISRPYVDLESRGFLGNMKTRLAGGLGSVVRVTTVSVSVNTCPFDRVAIHLCIAVTDHDGKGNT